VKDFPSAAASGILFLTTLTEDMNMAAIAGIAKGVIGAVAGKGGGKGNKKGGDKQGGGPMGLLAMASNLFKGGAA
jgi:hypothetical protein